MEIGGPLAWGVRNVVQILPRKWVLDVIPISLDLLTITGGFYGGVVLLAMQ